MLAFALNFTCTTSPPPLPPTPPPGPPGPPEGGGGPYFPKFHPRMHTAHNNDVVELGSRIWGQRMGYEGSRLAESERGVWFWLNRP